MSSTGLKIFSAFLLLLATSLKSQTEEPGLYKPNPEKEKMFLPYLAVRHGGPVLLQEWKKSNTVLYYKELWYYCESFYTVRNYYPTGAALSESMIDVSRFEAYRKEDVEVILPLEGFKDAVILLPTNKLLYKL